MNFRRIKERYQFIIEGRDILILFIIFALFMGLSFGLGVIVGKALVKPVKSVVKKEESNLPVYPEKKTGGIKVISLGNLSVKPTSHPVELTSPTSLQQHPQVVTPAYIKSEKLSEESGEKRASEVKRVSVGERKEKKVKESQVKKRAVSEISGRLKHYHSEKKVEKKEHPKKVIKYTIQVASYRTRTEAIRLIQKLKKAGFDAYLMTADLGRKGVWYRVRVGYFYSRSEAQGTVQKLKKYHFKPIIAEVGR